MQLLFLAAIADVKERGGKALEAFACRYVEGESAEERFLVHRTVFLSDFLADFGFRIVVSGASSWRDWSSGGSSRFRSRRALGSSGA